ncbi:hypothetical protein BDQ17DRAFT_1540768 [Cyathus striatus]|nr:hypothetical protein BDQ17DRAFT_1540768 [Cyathus striatus]
MVLNKELFAPVALDYIKLIRCMLSWPPHLEHLENETWIELVQLGFNVVLQEPLKQSLESKEAGWLALEDRRGESHVSDEEDDELPTVSPGTRKRRRGSDLPTTPARRTPQLSKRKLPQIMKVSLEQTEFAALLSILLRSPAAPFHLSQYEYLPSAILSRLYRFIEVYPSDSSLMNDYLSILSSTLSHVSLNKKSDVQRFGRSSWNGYFHSGERKIAG